MSTPAEPLLRRLSADEVVARRRDAVDPQVLAEAARIVNEVCVGGIEAAARHAVRLGDLREGDPVLIEPDGLKRALDRLGRDDRRALEGAAASIRRFADAQRTCLTDLTVDVPGGQAGHRVIPLDSAGCYAPGGRYPLPSSVLMTAVTARAAGVGRVWVASPNPAPVTLAAAAIAGADGLLAIGGAQAIACLAYGAGPVPPCAIVVGPGSAWVTAAKHVVSRDVAIDMLAGPSELVVIADDCADPQRVAIDMLAQAEHDAQACAVLITTSAALASGVDEALGRRLEVLPTRDVARRALTRQGGCVLVESLDRAVEVAERLAPEHLHVATGDAAAVASRCTRYGSLFIGQDSPEVLGDYGIGPNHVLPTGGTARAFSGLSVQTFVRWRTWTRIDRPDGAGPAYERAARLAALEGLSAHAESALARLRR